MIYLRMYRQVNSERALSGYFSGVSMLSLKQAVVKMTMLVLPSSEGEAAIIVPTLQLLELPDL